MYIFPIALNFIKWTSGFYGSLVKQALYNLFMLRLLYIPSRLSIATT